MERIQDKYGDDNLSGIIITEKYDEKLYYAQNTKKI